MATERETGVAGARQARGAMGHARGLAAEAQVETEYLRRGARCLARRWRGSGGEIDLILQMGGDIVFVEVKASRTIAEAARHLTRGQAARLLKSAEEFLGTQPWGSLTPMRIDVALLDGQGRIEILENALMEG